MNLKWSHVVPSFVAGLVVATLLCLFCPRGRWHFNDGGAQFESRMVKRFARDLKLNPDQKEKLTVIIRGKQKKINDVRCEMKPRFDEIREATDSEIQEILTPDQRTRFDAIKASRAEREAKRDKRRGLLCDGIPDNIPPPPPGQ
jgi:Spy/CpxP family protein refolding chaperone